MGKAHVVLYDDQMRFMMLVHWGDAWVGATKGYLNAYFYP